MCCLLCALYLLDHVFFAVKIHCYCCVLLCLFFCVTIHCYCCVRFVVFACTVIYRDFLCVFVVCICLSMCFCRLKYIVLVACAFVFFLCYNTLLLLCAFCCIWMYCDLSRLFICVYLLVHVVFYVAFTRTCGAPTTNVLHMYLSYTHCSCVPHAPLIRPSCVSTHLQHLFIMCFCCILHDTLMRLHAYFMRPSCALSSEHTAPTPTFMLHAPLMRPSCDLHAP